MLGIVETEEAMAMLQGEAVALKESVESDLGQVIPILQSVFDDLNGISKTDIQDMKSLKSPPASVALVGEALCVMFDKKPNWPTAKKLLAEANLVDKLRSYDRDNIPPKIIAKIERDFMVNEKFNPEYVGKASKGGEVICRWVRSMFEYDKLSKIVAPKKKSLFEIERKIVDMKTALDAVKLAPSLRMGKRKWGRSKIMIVGEGRAGKSAFANTVIGRPYIDTESTVGINQLTCDIKYASIGSGNGWAEYEKPSKELESAIASMIVNGVNPGDHSDVNDTSTTTHDDLREVDADEGNDPKRLECENVLEVIEKTTESVEISGGAFSMSQGATVSPDGTIGKYMDENHGGGVEDNRVEISDSDANSFDHKLVMKCLADKVQTESKIVISVFDFGGQSVFNVR